MDVPLSYKTVYTSTCSRTKYGNSILFSGFMSQIIEPEIWQGTFQRCPSAWQQLRICPCSHNKFHLEHVEFGSNISLQAEGWHMRRTPSEQRLGFCRRRQKGEWLFRISLYGVCLQREVSEVKRQAHVSSASCSFGFYKLQDWSPTKEKGSIFYCQPWHDFPT